MLILSIKATFRKFPIVGIGASAGGLEAIKEKDGIVLVQSPDSTKFAGMPECGLEQ